MDPFADASPVVPPGEGPAGAAPGEGAGAHVGEGVGEGVGEAADVDRVLAEPDVPGIGDLAAQIGSSQALTDAEFSAAVVAVTSAFGDPTRRHIYLFARDKTDGVTAGEVAARFALHPNVARHHLDKLAAGGYLDVFATRGSHGGAGRPSKRYRQSGPAAGLELPLKGDDLLITLLGRALALVPDAAAEAMAEEVGEEYGRRLAGQMSTGHGQRSFRAALHAVADALTAHGFAAHAEARGRSLVLIKDSCPFFDAARQHPVICAVDRGMVRGMLTGLYGEAVPATESSRAMGDDACVTLV